MSDRCCTCSSQPARRRTGLLGTLFNVALLYALLVAGGGTLQQVNHPVAVELGRLMHTVTFVEPAIAWAQRNDHPAIATGLVTLANGVPIG